MYRFDLQNKKIESDENGVMDYARQRRICMLSYSCNTTYTISTWLPD